MVSKSTLVRKVAGQKCDICYGYISPDDIAKREFEYSRTKRKGDIFVHTKCWNKLYGRNKHE